MRVEMHVFKFRPSSHSEDFTIIARYQDGEKAKRAYDALRKLIDYLREHEEKIDWSPDEAKIWINGNKIRFDVYTAGYLDDVESVMRTAANPDSVEWWTNYQQLEISVRVPHGLTPQAAMIVLDKEEAQAIRWLVENCGEPKVTELGNQDKWSWIYRGENIYSYNNDTLYLGFEFSLESRKNWLVEEVEDEDEWA
jgi:hypothetical protein